MLKIPALYLCLLMSGSAWALGPPAAMTEAEFDALMQQISNWNHNAGVNGVFTRGVLVDMPRSLIGAAALDLDG